MEEQSKEQIITYLEKASVIILCILFILFPVLFTNLTTDLFVIPKQALLVFSVLSLMVLYAAKTFLSVVFSVARFDSLFNFIPFLFAAFSFFAITYNVKNERSLYALISSLLIGGAIVSVVSILSFLKIYILRNNISRYDCINIYINDSSKTYNSAY